MMAVMKTVAVGMCSRCEPRRQPGRKCLSIFRVPSRHQVTRAGDPARVPRLCSLVAAVWQPAIWLCSGSLSSLSWGGPGSDNADSVTPRTR